MVSPARDPVFVISELTVTIFRPFSLSACRSELTGISLTLAEVAP